MMQLSTTLSLSGWFLVIVAWTVFPLSSLPLVILNLSALFLFQQAGRLIQQNRKQL